MNRSRLCSASEPWSRWHPNACVILSASAISIIAYYLAVDDNECKIFRYCRALSRAPRCPEFGAVRVYSILRKLLAIRGYIAINLMVRRLTTNSVIPNLRHIFCNIPDQRLSQNGIAGFVRSIVRGKSRVPKPAARIIAFKFYRPGQCYILANR